MRSLRDYSEVFFLGIGGIGMSALARWFHAEGFLVSGYDKVLSPITDSLKGLGIEVTDIDSSDALLKSINKETSLIIYTPAIPRGSQLRAYFEENEFGFMKRAKVLGMITSAYYTIAVAGTHGKTTTSSMVTHILKEGGYNVAGFLGGIATNYATNMVFEKGVDGDVIAVVEADEYDRSFLNLSPNLAIITGVDPDHLDIYDDTADFENTFKEFAALLDPPGALIQQEDIAMDILPKGDERPVIKYGFGDVKAQAYNVRAVDGEQVFDLYYQDIVLTDVVLTVPGLHNIQNVLAAATAAFCMGMDPDAVKDAIGTYRGVKRRFEYIQKESNFVYVDDYAHHPSELQAFISSVRALFPEKKLEVVFQPHLFTRTRDFIDGFASALSQVDKLWLLDIYPARELPIEGVTSDWLLNKIDGPVKEVISKEDLLKAVTRSDNTVFATLGAGDVGRLVEPLKKRFEKVG